MNRWIWIVFLCFIVGMIGCDGYEHVSHTHYFTHYHNAIPPHRHVIIHSHWKHTDGGIKHDQLRIFSEDMDAHHKKHTMHAYINHLETVLVK